MGRNLRLSLGSQMMFCNRSWFRLQRLGLWPRFCWSMVWSNHSWFRLQRLGLLQLTCQRSNHSWFHLQRLGLRRQPCFCMRQLCTCSCL